MPFANLTDTSQRLSDTAQEKVNEYQSIVSVANDMFSDFMERVPYLLVALVVFIVFWLLSIAFKKAVTKLLSKSH